MARWDETQPVFDGMKVPEWAMVDPFQQIAENMARKEQHEAQMRQAQLAEQKQQMDIEARMQQQQMQQGIAEYVRSNPSATPDQVYGAVQQSALAGGDVGTWLRIAEQMHEQNMMQERARREQERQAMAANNSALTTMARLQGINPQDPQAAYNYARAMGLTDEFGITPDSLRRPEKERKGGSQKQSSYKPYAVFDPTTNQNIMVNVNDPNVQARIDAGLLLPKVTDPFSAQIARSLAEPDKADEVRVQMPRYQAQEPVGRIPQGQDIQQRGQQPAKKRNVIVRPD